MKNIKKSKNEENEQKMIKNEYIKARKRQKTGEKKKYEKKGKEGPKGVAPDMGPKIDFSHKKCQERS